MFKPVRQFSFNLFIQSFAYFSANNLASDNFTCLRSPTVEKLSYSALVLFIFNVGGSSSIRPYQLQMYVMEGFTTKYFIFFLNFYIQDLLEDYQLTVQVVYRFLVSCCMSFICILFWFVVSIWRIFLPYSAVCLLPYFEFFGSNYLIFGKQFVSIFWRNIFFRPSAATYI